MIVASSDDDEDTGVEEEVSGQIIGGLRKATFYRHVGNGSIWTVPRLAVICNKCHSFQDIRKDGVAASDLVASDLAASGPTSSYHLDGV